MCWRCPLVFVVCVHIGFAITLAQFLVVFYIPGCALKIIQAHRFQTNIQAHRFQKILQAHRECKREHQIKVKTDDNTTPSRMQARASIPTKSRRQYQKCFLRGRQNASEGINPNQKSTTVRHLLSCGIARIQARASNPSKHRRPYDTFFPAGSP